MECQNCGVEFESSGANASRQKFCNEKCQSRYRYRHPNGRRRICEGCGVEFIPKESNRGRFCTRECSFAHNCGHSIKDGKYKQIQRLIAKLRRIKECRVCGNKTFTNECSIECRKKWSDHKYGKRYPDITIEKACIDCGSLFFVTYVVSHAARKRCPICKKKFEKSYANHGKQEKRARKAGVVYQYIDKHKVFERDGWRCHICKRKTPEKYIGTYNPMAPELDHIVPLNPSYGANGSHTYENVKCCCRECNSKKSNTPLGQPMLFGMIPTISNAYKRVMGAGMK